MLIALDVGNSHVRLGGFCGDDLKFVASMETNDRRTGEEYACTLRDIFALYGVQPADMDGVVLCSVVPSMIPVIQKAFSLLSDCRVLVVTNGIKTGLNVKIDQPRTLGSDRVAVAAWACHHAALPCVIVDLGTATTFTALDASGALVGSAIAAGIGISLAALKANAAQLPTVGIEQTPASVLGRTTAEAMQIGAAFGTAAMIDGMAERYREALGEGLTVLLTGGAADTVRPLLKTQVDYIPELSLRGLALIYHKNRQE